MSGSPLGVGEERNTLTLGSGNSGSQEEELGLDDQILSALNDLDICTKDLPNGGLVGSNHCPANASSEESDDNLEEPFNAYMPLPQHSDEDPDTEDESVNTSRPDVQSDVGHHLSVTHHDAPSSADERVDDGLAASKPSTLEKGKISLIFYPIIMLNRFQCSIMAMKL